MHTRQAALAAAVLAVGLIATGCSSSSGSSGEAGSNLKGEPIPIGAVGTYSGPLASSIGIAKEGIEAWATAVNASGGINGRPIKLYTEDDAGDVAQSLTAVKKLVEQDHVVAIVGQASGNAAPWGDYVKEKGIPVVGGNPASNLYTSNDDFFAVGGNPLSTFYGVSAAAKANGTSLGTIYCAEVPACAETVNLFKAFTPATGVQLSYSTKAAASSRDFVAPCQGLKNAGVQSYILSLAAATQDQVVGACKQQKVNATLLVSGSTANSNMASKPDYNGAVVVNPVVPFSDESIPATRAMHAALTKYAPSAGSEKNPLNFQATQTWVSGKLFEAAVKASGSKDITPATIKAGLYALKGETLGGLTVPLTYAQGKPTLFNCSFITKIVDGKFTEPQGLKPQCAPDSAIAALLKT